MEVEEEKTEKIEDRRVWVDERLRNGKATGNYVLNWVSSRGEILRYNGL